MSKNAIARARYFANRKARRDQQNEFNKQNNLRPVSLRTMKKITPPAPKPKVIPPQEIKQIEINPAVVENRETKVEKQVLRAARKAKVTKQKAAPVKYSKKVKITLNKKVTAKKIVKAVTKTEQTNKKVVATAKKKAALVKKAAPKKIVKVVAKKVTKNKKK